MHEPGRSSPIPSSTSAQPLTAAHGASAAPTTACLRASPPSCSSTSIATMRKPWADRPAWTAPNNSGERVEPPRASNPAVFSLEWGVERAQRGDVGVLVFGGMEQRAESDHLARIIEVARQDRHAGLARDVPEARFPLADGLARAFGFDAQPQAFAGVEAPDHLAHDVGRGAAFDRHAAKLAQQTAQWPAEQFALGHEADIGTECHLEQQSPDTVPP